MTHAFYDHMQPDRTLVIEASAVSPYTQHLDWYPDETVVNWDGGDIDETILRTFLAGLSVVYTAETPYSYNLYTIARDMGVRTVCHVMPEFYRHAIELTLPVPDEVWLPTPWLADRIPHSRILPVPIDRAHLPYRHRDRADTFLHVIGRRAVWDRNGTQLVLKAFRKVRNPTTLVIRSQGRVPRVAVSRHVTLRIIEATDLDDYADLYADGDVMVLPRRFGGLCLPAQEALSTGMPVLMPNCSPNDALLPPGMLIPTRPGPPLRTQAGPVPTFDTSADALAAAIDRLIEDPAAVSSLSSAADAIAHARSWEVLRSAYIDALEAACAADRPVVLREAIRGPSAADLASPAP